MSVLDASRLRYVRDPEAAQRAVALLAGSRYPVLGVDVETHPRPEHATDKRAGLDPHRSRVRLVSVAAPDSRVAVFDLQRVPVELLQPLAALPWVAQNATFDARHLAHAGLTLPERMHCSMILQRLVSGDYMVSLADAAEQVLQVKLEKEQQRSDWSQPELTPQQIEYAGTDALAALRLAQALRPKLNGARIVDLAARVLPVLAMQMNRGILLDWQRLAGWTAEQRGAEAAARVRFTQAMPDVNPDSPAQLAAWLQQTLTPKQLERWPRTGKGALCTDADTLALHNIPELSDLRAVKRAAKLASTYGDGYAKHRNLVTGRVHPDFLLLGADTGRYRCRNPNLQNPPRDADMRAMVIPGEGRVLVVGDLSQIELRCAAALSGDPVMLQAYRDGQDLHRITASRIARVRPERVSKAQRQSAKAVNFGLLFGQRERGLSACAKTQYNVEMSLEQARDYRSTFLSLYEGFHLWQLRTIMRAQATGEVQTALGLRRKFLPHENVNTIGLNTPIQGTAAEVLNESIVRMRGRDVVHHVHDELIAECAPEDAAEVSQHMQQAMEQAWCAVFPALPELARGITEVHHGRNWSEAKP